jgi:hypothetical protein
MKMSLLAKRTDLYYQKEPPETCIRYLSKYHPAAATIESIPSSQELSEIGIHYLQTQQLPQHLLLSKHKLALSKIKNTSLKLPMGVSPLQLVNSHRNRRYFVINHTIRRWNVFLFIKTSDRIQNYNFITKIRKFLFNVFMKTTGVQIWLLFFFIGEASAFSIEHLWVIGLIPFCFVK